MGEKKLMTIWVTKSQYEDILRRYGKDIIPPKSIMEGNPVVTVNKRSPIGLEFRTN